MGASSVVIKGMNDPETMEAMACREVVIKGMNDPETMEAMACREGMALASDLLLYRFRVVSGCINVIQSIEGEGRGPDGHIVRELKARKTDFQMVQFVHEGRSSNIDAHCLARSSIYLEVGRHV
jgi:hypothetical protein